MIYSSLFGMALFALALFFALGHKESKTMEYLLLIVFCIMYVIGAFVIVSLFHEESKKMGTTIPIMSTPVKTPLKLVQSSKTDTPSLPITKVHHKHKLHIVENCNADL